MYEYISSFFLAIDNYLLTIESIRYTKFTRHFLRRDVVTDNRTNLLLPVILSCYAKYFIAYA